MQTISKVRAIFTWVLRGVIGLLFLVVGIEKLTGTYQPRRRLNQFERRQAATNAECPHISLVVVLAFLVVIPEGDLLLSLSLLLAFHQTSHITAKNHQLTTNCPPSNTRVACQFEVNG